MSIAQALVQAFAYGDSADVAWYRECNDPTFSMKISLTRDPSGSEDLIASWALHSRPFLTSTRGFKRELDLGTCYGIQDLVVVEWQGDSAAQVAMFRDQWMRAIEKC